MTSTINASTTAGIVTTADTSAILQLQTNGTAAVTVDTSQNVGIGTASPAGKLDVASGNSYLGGLRLNGANTTDTIYQATGDIGVSAATAANIKFNTNGAERMRILTTGNILSLSGGSTTATGTGIAFPATQSASSDVNTLDDYEEGTWTPTVTAGSGSITSLNTQGQYRKVGSLVSLQFYYQITNNGTGASSINVTNLPFANNIGANTSAGVIREIAVTGVTGSLYFQSTTNLLLVNYNNGYPGGLNNYYVCSVCYYTT